MNVNDKDKITRACKNLITTIDTLKNEDRREIERVLIRFDEEHLPARETLMKVYRVMEEGKHAAKALAGVAALMFMTDAEAFDNFCKDEEDAVQKVLMYADDGLTQAILVEDDRPTPEKTERRDEERTK